jgi:hypothetical protein
VQEINIFNCTRHTNLIVLEGLINFESRFVAERWNHIEVFATTRELWAKFHQAWLKSLMCGRGSIWTIIFSFVPKNNFDSILCGTLSQLVRDSFLGFHLLLCKWAFCRWVLCVSLKFLLLLSKNFIFHVFCYFCKNSVQVFSCVQSNFRVVLVQPIFFKFCFLQSTFLCLVYQALETWDNDIIWLKNF